MSRTVHTRLLPAAAALTSLALLVAAGASSATATREHRPDAKATYTQLTKASPAKGGAKKDYVKVDLLAINDFHGQLEPVPATSSSGRINNTPAGGAAYLARLLKQERARSRAAGAAPLTVAAGDLIGATPLLSGAFHDEPTIKAMNLLGLQVASVGNHEFDEGWRELRRMQNGGCLDDGPDGANGANSCPGDQGFGGADFRYLAANVKWADGQAHARDTLFPATKIMKVKGQKVAFIGMTLEGTPDIVTAAGVQGLAFADEVKTANALVPKLRKRGIRSIVVLLHEGVKPADTTAYNDCSGVSGPALEIAQKLSPAIDAVVSGHTHQAYNCLVKDPKGQPRLLTSAMSIGRMLTKIHLLIDPTTHDVVRPAEYADNLIAQNGADVTPVPAVQSLIDTYKALVAPIENQVVGHIEPGTSVSRTADADGGDSPLGNLIADAQVADGSTVEAGASGRTAVEPVIALMNPGGIRADLLENAAGDVTYGATFTVQPFNNYMVSMDLTGAQIKALLNQQWNGTNEASRKILQVSGLSYAWDTSEAAAVDADALVPGSVMVDADGDPATPMVPIDDAATYRVVANNFLYGGGDGFSTFTESTNGYFGGLDIDALVKYLQEHDPVAASATDRITQVP
ncbi:bifunctional metallophosphatase/5'-nucleotidase [Nocardioides sp. T2.26MG-1]|uniref:bifunctional metallophosphatase/5'-nucleotidase n=1 Tax=Nocardioides sp. T2.26MG-1 TaxID=3041166 RepID=UPI0024773FB2|nr:5'-nucleotidase C-terminal domain-containing protein [Nocardioides sp. T2.26MG-1]CAI9412046.1 Cell wall protein [Nocardioides sp. T2.26MG-1]